MPQLIRFQKIGEKKVHSKVTTKPLTIVRNILGKYGYYIIHNCEYEDGDTIKILSLKRVYDEKAI